MLILSMYSEDNYVRNAFASGALGYLLKNALEVDLPYAIKEVAAGRTVLTPGLAMPTADHDSEMCIRDRSSRPPGPRQPSSLTIANI